MRTEDLVCSEPGPDARTRRIDRADHRPFLPNRAIASRTVA